MVSELVGIQTAKNRKAKTNSKSRGGSFWEKATLLY